jgi:putative hydrolase of the HAD superfamily
MPEITCVLFDLDNTLTDRDASLRVFAQRFMDDFYTDLDPAVHYDMIHQVIINGDGGGYRPKDEMFSELLTGLQWETAPTLEMLSNYWYGGSPYCMQPRYGVQSTLEALAKRGISLGIVSNGQTTAQNGTLDVLHIRHLLGTVVISEEVGLRKPDPAIFHLALSHLNVAPEHALYVGDHPRSDVDGARQAGLRAAWFSGMHAWPDDLPAPEFEMTEIEQVLEIL